MSEWIVLTLDELGDISGGGTPSRNNPKFWGGGIPWVTPSDITACDTNYLFDTTDTITERGVASSSAKLLPEGALLLTSRATIGEIRIAARPVTTNQGFKNIVPKPIVDGVFLFYQLSRIREKFKRYAAGSTFLEINRRDTGRVTVTLPRCKKLQKKIARILQTIDQAIEKTEALIDKYQQIKAGLMHGLFTRGIGADGQLRLPREQAPELYQETPIGWIPKEWVFSSIGSYVLSADYGISTGLDDEEDGIAVLRMNNIKSNSFDVSDLKYSKNADAYRLALKEGDVLYNRTNSFEHVGKTAIWKRELDQCSFASYLVRINLDINSLLPDFFAHWMSQVPSQNALRRYATPGVQQVNINPKNLQRVDIGVPDTSEQTEIVRRIDCIDEKLESEMRFLRKIHKHKSGLMHDLLTGKVPVRVEPEVEPEAADV